MRVKDVQWQDSADVLVVGYGGAGAVAAITAHDLGAEVLLVEKQPRDGRYTNTQMSGGLFICPTDVEKAVGYVETLYHVEEGTTSRSTPPISMALLPIQAMDTAWLWNWGQTYGI